MRILYLHQYFNTPEMAGGTRSYEMARRLVAAGHDVQMITTDRAGVDSRPGAWRVTEEGGIEVSWIPISYSNRMGFTRRIHAFLRFAWCAARRAVELGGDIVLATSTPLTIAIPGMVAARKLRIPMVFEVRDLWPEVPIALGVIKNPALKWLATNLEHMAYRSSERVVTVAPGMKAAVASSGFPEDRITIIPNGADAELFDVDPRSGKSLRARTDWLGDRPLVLYCGALGIVNATEFTVRLAAEVGRLDPEVRFAIIGEGVREERMRRLALEWGLLGKSFFMLGRKPKLEIPEWLSAATLATAFLSGPEVVWRDASQNKFFDALAAGKPVVTNFRGFQSIVAEQAGCGVILDSADPAGAARLLVERLYDEDWLKQASASARRLVREQFDRDLLARQLALTLEQARADHVARIGLSRA